VWQKLCGHPESYKGEPSEYQPDHISLLLLGSYNRVSHEQRLPHLCSSWRRPSNTGSHARSTGRRSPPRTLSAPGKEENVTPERRGAPQQFWRWLIQHPKQLRSSRSLNLARLPWSCDGSF
jgi:hypothetical protein